MIQSQAYNTCWPQSTYTYYSGRGVFYGQNTKAQKQGLRQGNLMELQYDGKEKKQFMERADTMERAPEGFEKYMAVEQ